MENLSLLLCPNYSLNCRLTGGNHLPTGVLCRPSYNRVANSLKRTLSAQDRFSLKKIQLTLQLELWHLNDYTRLPPDEFAKIPNWMHEQSVWEKIWASRERWTQGELLDSYIYYKKSVNRAGENPIKIDDLELLIQ
jgi:hypothetical protein